MIWLVSDHSDTRASLPPSLAARGYPVDEIACGDEAYKRLRFQKPSLLIVDCGIRDSFDLVAKVRAEPRCHGLPIIMFSVEKEDLKEKAILKGADAFVPKGPLDWMELFDEVRRFAGDP